MSVEHQRAADAVRKIIESLQVTELTDDEYSAFADRVEEIASELAAHPHRESWHDDPTVSLATVFTPDAQRRWDHDDHSPVAGKLNAAAPPLHMSVDGDRLRGEVTLNATYEGAPMTVHGGVVSALFDEMLGNAQRVARIAGYTGTISVRFNAPTPTYTPLVLEAWVDRIEGRKIFLAGTLHANDTCTAQAEGIFIRPRLD